MTTNEPTTVEMIDVLRENGDVYFGETEITCDQIADRLESQERELSGISGELEQYKKWHDESIATATNNIVELEHQIAALTARAEQAEKERDTLISSIERLRTKKIELCSICEFEDLIACCHKNHCEGYQLFKRRGLPQDGEGK